ncbi:hypothetical protein DL764_001685 [Monosporascus ibericus]|uniref:Mitochondrial carrier protein n=1 Tax=Monosporascus ibericus TaxID=155417 RepID=A0A4Q4TQY5_9PEZI|nr:hypothetical protein DL764_001685 [Monosporascus ibericus]
MMAANNDSESQMGSNEQTPLLSERRPSREEHQQTPLLEGQETPRDEHEQAALLEPPPEKRTRSWWFRRIFWAIVAVVILAVFIKGWIDADDTHFDLKGALKRALGGGLSGAAAMVLQVLLLMLPPGPCIMTVELGDITKASFPRSSKSNPYMSKLPSPIKTVFASLCAAAFRIILTPIDTLKTTLQAQGARGTALLRRRIKTNGVGSLWWGAIATAAATFVGHYPWFATYNFLSEVLTEPPKHPLIVWLARLAFIGFCASIVSDSVSNSLRVVKTYRQVNDIKVSYCKLSLPRERS